MSSRARVALLAIAIGCIAVGVYLSYRQRQTLTRPVPPAPPPEAAFVAPPLQSGQIFLGNPSGARPDSSDHGNYLMLKPCYAVAYDDAAGEPRWVGWRVTASDLGEAPRKRTFDPDASLPAGFHVVVTGDYAGGGFDRGHMCPHSDRGGSVEMSYATFVMSNIIPQAPAVNQKAWARLEDYCRELVRSHHDRLYIVSGPWGRGGVGTRGPATTLVAPGGRAGRAVRVGRQLGQVCRGDRLGDVRDGLRGRVERVAAREVVARHGAGDPVPGVGTVGLVGRAGGDDDADERVRRRREGTGRPPAEVVPRRRPEVLRDGVGNAVDIGADALQPTWRQLLAVGEPRRSG